MATDLERLVVQLSADIKGYERALRKAGVETGRAARQIETRFNRMNQNVSRSMTTLGSAVSQLNRGLALFGTGFTATAIVTGITSIINELGDLQDAADRAGTSAENLQRVFEFGRDFGLQVEDAEKLLRKFRTEIGEAATKGNDLGKILEANNIPLRDANGQIRDQLALFKDVLGLIQRARTEQEAAVIASAGFGREGQKWLVVLRQGPEAFQRIGDEAQKAGRIFNNEIVAQADRLADEWEKMWTSFKNEAVSAILPVIELLKQLDPRAVANRLRTAFGFEPILDRTPQEIAGEKLVEEQARLQALQDERLQTEKNIQNAIEMGSDPALLAPMKARLDEIQEQIKQIIQSIQVLKGIALPSIIQHHPTPPKPTTVIPDLGRSADKLSQATSDLEKTIDKAASMIVGFESGGQPGAANPRSTAVGLGQFIESTWLRLFRENFPDRAAELSRGAILALRQDSQTSLTLIKAYARENAAVLQAAGVSVDEAALQLAHFLGPQGALAVLKAPPGTPLSQVLSPEVIAANREVLAGKTTDELIREAQAREGVTGTVIRQREAVQQLIDSLNEELAATQAEREEMGLSTAEAEKARLVRETLAEAKRQGITLTQQEIAAIQQIAAQYGQEKAAIEQISEAQKKAAQSADQLRQSQEAVAQMGSQLESAFSGALKGFISDLIHGKSLTEALRDALINLADQLISIALDSLFKGLFSGTTGGGGLLAGLFHSGGIAGRASQARLIAPQAFTGARRFHRGGLPGVAAGEVPAILKRGEIVIPDMKTLRTMIHHGGEGTRDLRPITQNITFVAQEGPILARTQNQLSKRAMNDLQRAQRIS